MPNFVAETEVIKSLPTWVRFPVLSVEYYSEKWLRRAGDRISKTIKVDDTMRATTRGKFARVCVEVDLTKPVKAGYRMRGRQWHLQYEGLHELCFVYGQYRHREASCHMGKPQCPPTEARTGLGVEANRNKAMAACQFFVTTTNLWTMDGRPTWWPKNDDDEPEGQNRYFTCSGK